MLDHSVDEVLYDAQGAAYGIRHGDEARYTLTHVVCVDARRSDPTTRAHPPDGGDDSQSLIHQRAHPHPTPKSNPLCVYQMAKAKYVVGDPSYFPRDKVRPTGRYVMYGLTYGCLCVCVCVCCPLPACTWVV